MAYIYVLSNKSMPGLVKVGMTAGDPKERAVQLSTTGVPEKFVVEMTWECEDKHLRKIEGDLHRALDDYRYSRNREFFSVDIEVVKSVVNAYFREKRELDFKAIKEARREKERLERVDNVTSSVISMEIDLHKDTLNIIHGIKEKADAISRYLNLKANPRNSLYAVKSFREEMGFQKESVLDQTRWQVRVGVFDGIDSADIDPPLGDACIHMFIGAKTKKETYWSYVLVSYRLNDGAFIGRPNDINVVNRNASMPIFSASLKDFLAKFQLWERLECAQNSYRLLHGARITCPDCQSGRLVKHQETGQWGCDSDACSFYIDTGTLLQRAPSYNELDPLFPRREPSDRGFDTFFPVRGNFQEKVDIFDFSPKETFFSLLKDSVRQMGFFDIVYHIWLLFLLFGVTAAWVVILLK